MTGQANSIFFAVHGATKRFGALTAVNNVSFEVNEGEIFGIAGPNGSGKSTLFNIITSVPFPVDEGRITFKGRDITRMPPHRICRTGLARTFQRESTFPGLSAFDNVLVAVEHSDEAGKVRENEARAEDALDFVGFPKTMHNTIAGALPLFNRKQLMLATAAALSPRLLLLDEPASSLTRPEIQKLEEIITRINRAGISVLLIEHVLALLTTVSQRMLILNHGNLLSIGKPDEVTKDPKVVEAYLGNQGGAHATTS
jgi:branched-chain amino acid transport system ATP-binding protein/branched-chain amino acid transport system permease protein